MSDAALRIHCDPPRMVPPRERGASRESGPAWVHDDLWLYRVRSLRSQSFLFIVFLREFSFLAGARHPPPRTAIYYVPGVRIKFCAILVAIDHCVPGLFSPDNVLVPSRFIDYWLRNLRIWRLDIYVYIFDNGTRIENRKVFYRCRSLRER